MISTVVKQGSYLYVYDEDMRTLFTVSIDYDDCLQGYTSSTVSVKKGGYIYIYDESGNIKGTVKT